MTPFADPLAVDVVREGSLDEQLLVEELGEIYRVRRLETGERRLEIERSRLYGHVFLVFEPEMAPVAVDLGEAFSILARTQPALPQEIEIVVGDAGTWNVLLRGEGVIVSAGDEALFLHGRPVESLLQ